MKLLSKFLNLSLKTKILSICLATIIVAGGVVSGVVINKNIKEKNMVIIKDEVTININEDMPKAKTFIKKKGNLSSDIKLELGKLKDTKEVGSYNVIIVDKKNNKKYKSKIVIVDKKSPNLKLKDVAIEEGEELSINSFVESCIDNSNKECTLYFVDENKNKIDDIDKSVGERKIYIIAEDKSGNKTKVLEANLTVTEKKQEEKNTSNKTSGKTNSNSNNNSSYDPEKDCYKTPSESSILAYKFPCGVTSKEAYAKLEDLKANYFKERISKVMNDHCYGHGCNFNAGYYMITAKYNSSYVVGIHVPFSLSDVVDKVSSYGYLKPDGTASWVYYRESGR